MKKWEYSMVPMAFYVAKTPENIDELNKRGQDGWEAVAVVQDGWILMKREIPEPGEKINKTHNADFIDAYARAVTAGMDDGRSD